jgi:hypothetical protein
MFACYRIVSRDWALRLITIEEFRKTALQATYIQLAADAEEEFHSEIIKKLKRLGRTKK